jgi:hypothetical protein
MIGQVDEQETFQLTPSSKGIGNLSTPIKYSCGAEYSTFTPFIETPLTSAAYPSSWGSSYSPPYHAFTTHVSSTPHYLLNTASPSRIHASDSYAPVTTSIFGYTQPQERRKSLPSKYPNRASHLRKLQAFRHVKVLVIVDLPSKLFSVKFEGWAKGRLAREDSKLLPDVESFIICERAMWQMGEWSERHGGAMHPFGVGLKAGISAQRVCASYPLVNEHSVEDFCERLLGPVQASSRCTDALVGATLPWTGKAFG